VFGDQPAHHALMQSAHTHRACWWLARHRGECRRRICSCVRPVGGLGCVAHMPLTACGALAAQNLQKTPKDSKATIVIHAKVDQVMADVMAILLMRVPRFIRTDQLLINTKYVPRVSPPGPLVLCGAHVSRHRRLHSSAPRGAAWVGRSDLL
jgi:hypothetical protein